MKKEEHKLAFYPYEKLSANSSEEKLWGWFKEAFKNDEAIIYFRYPVFIRSGGKMCEPDILMVHRKYGLWVFECKGCSIANIQAIQGHEWSMGNWYAETMQPLLQAEDQMYAIKNKLEENRETREKLFLGFRVALPQIKLTDWQAKGFDRLPSTGAVLVYEQLTPAALRKHIEENHQQQPVSDREWLMIKGVLGGTLPPPTEKPDIPTGTEPDNPIRVIRAMESQLKVLDDEQQRAAFEIPDGPQRLRGLAGTGKTVLFAKRVAKMHIKHPDWIIGFVFFTKSLYQQIQALITRYYQEMHPDHERAEPDWTKIKVLHAWGGKNVEGFYSSLALKCGVRPKSLSDVKRERRDIQSPDKTFDYICQCLQRDAGNIPTLYDAIIIDEGQDLPPSFYQLAYESLSQARRIYWAYDEAQGIGSLIIPEPSKIFGKTEAGALLVDVRGQYPGGIRKSRILNKCYRTPEVLLMAAHAVNMGLLREKGVLQGVSKRDEWEKLGYQVEGSFSKVGMPVSIQRMDSPHPTDQDNFPLKEVLDDSQLSLHPFDRQENELQWVAEAVHQDIKRGMKPEDILVTALCGDHEKQYFARLQYLLRSYDIESHIAGAQAYSDIDFRKKGCVTISNIYRAKGNEAWKVYACRFQYATHPLDWKQGETELHKRNEAFVALTRTRVWCVVTGIESPIFDELRQVIKQYPKLTFKAFNQSSLQRSTDEVDLAEENETNTLVHRPVNLSDNGSPTY